MASLLGGKRSRYSLERLKRLYSDLLDSIDISKEALGRRGSADHDDWEEDTSSEESEHEFSLVQVKRVLTFWGHPHRRRGPFRKASARRSDELAIAFRILAATRSPDKEGENGGAAVLRDDASVSALGAARAIEKRVARIIRDIGEVVANGDKAQGGTTSSRRNYLKCDPCFEYFCEKNILSLFVEIVKEKPHSAYQVGKPKIISPKHRVVWSALVKAQVMQAISLLMMSGARNPHVFYYLLSRNFINDLISSMLPLNQWTDPAMEKLMPAFVELLKNLALQLAGSPELFPFFTVRNKFPLFHAALEIGTSSFAQTDSFVHITCLNLIVNTMKVDNPDTLSWVASAVPELRVLSEHLCQLFLNRYHRIADLTNGPIVDGIRNNAIGIQLAALSDQIDVLNDVLSCEIPGLNLRLCESLLRIVISDVLRNLIVPRERAFIVVGISDLDVIPQRESLAQVSFVFMSQLFHQIEYAPLVRMLSVAMFHPKSTPLWKNYGKRYKQQGDDLDYSLIPALDAIAQGKLKGTDAIENPYRQELVKSLSGCYGEWRFIAAAIATESILWSEAIDIETLVALEIVPSGVVQGQNGKSKTETEIDDNTEKKEDDRAASVPENNFVDLYKPTAIEEAVATFIKCRPRSTVSSVLKTSLECAGSLALALFYQSLMSITMKWSECGRYRSLFFREGTSCQPIYSALMSANGSFCRRSLELQKELGVSDIFLELVESAVCSRYKRVSSSSRPGIKTAKNSQTKYACHLSQIGCASLAHSAEVLVRDYRGVNSTDVEQTRFNVQMAIHFRALCEVADQFLDKLECKLSSVSKINGSPLSDSRKNNDLTLDFVEIADEFAITFGALKDLPDIHTHLDLRGRMIFPCFSAAARATETGAPSTIRTLSEDVILRPASKLVLVLDPADVFVVKPIAKSGIDRGTVVCTIPLQSIIAAASDAEWLHIAVRHHDISRLIKNGKCLKSCLST